MHVVAQGLGSALYLTAGFAFAAAPGAPGGSVITQGYGTRLVITQGYGGAVSPQSPPTVALGGGNHPGGYINRYPRKRLKPEEQEAAKAPEPAEAPAPDLSPREKKRLRKQVERSLLAEGAQRRGFDELAGLLGTLQRQEAEAAQHAATIAHGNALAAMQDAIERESPALQAANDEEEALLLLMA